jgi:hypothetical protein
MPRFSAAYIERIAKDWQRAFAEAHGKTAPAVTWARGWFTINNERSPKYRRRQLERMTEVLRIGFDDNN